MADKQKLTRALIDRTKPAPNGAVVIRDTEVPGLFLQVTPHGSKSLLVRYRLGKGRDAPIKSPKLPVEPLEPGGIEKARRIARDWKAKGAEGIDAVRALREEATLPTVRQLGEDYIEEHRTKKRSIEEDLKRLQKFPKRFLNMRVKDVTDDDILKIHQSRSRTPYEANRLLSLLSVIFNYAVSRKWRLDNPAARIKKFHEEKRERYLSADELKRVQSAIEDYVADRGDFEAADAGDAIYLLLLTGCRKGELLSATWDQIDFDRKEWTKPSAHTKQKKVHMVTLSEPAMERLRAIRRRRDIPGRWVFPGRSGGHRTDIKRAWAEISRRAGVEDVRIHDLRHTAASVMLSAGVPLDHVGQVLGHTQAQTTLRYAHLLPEAKRNATDKLGTALDKKRS